MQINGSNLFLYIYLFTIYFFIIYSLYQIKWQGQGTHIYTYNERYGSEGEVCLEGNGAVARRDGDTAARHHIIVLSVTTVCIPNEKKMRH